MDLLEELQLLDRPYIPFELSIGKSKKSVYLRKLSAADSDALEAIYEDVWGRSVMKYTEIEPGKQNELQKVAKALSRLPQENLVSRLLGTRILDIQAMIQERVGKSIQQIQAEERAMRGPDGEVPSEHTEAYQDLVASVTSAEASAKDEISSEYESMSHEELVERLSQAEINMRAQRDGRIARNIARIFHTVYLDEAGTKVFPSAQSVSTLSEETVAKILARMDLALLEAQNDLPLDLPADLEQSEQP